jgi:hypothetical protein
MSNQAANETQEIPVSRVWGKFQTTCVAPVPGGQVFIQMHAIYETDPNSPNKAFTDATPSGNFQLWVKEGYPAAKFFKPGQRYILAIVEDGVD